MKHPTNSLTSQRSALPLLALALGACSEPATHEPARTPSETGVMVATTIFTPDSLNVYVGVFPEVPTGELDDSLLREFGNSNVFSFGGWVFVEEDGTVTRFTVNETLELVAPKQFSWVNFGIAESNARYTVFVSSTRAYTFAPDLEVVLVWSPEEMELTGTLPVEVPARPPALETYAYDGRLVGDKVIWNVLSTDWENYAMYHATTLAIANAYDDAPIRWVEDDRCTGGGTSRVDENGDLYVHAGGNLGFFAAYGEGAETARTCLLRVNAGEESFDPDYLVDYEELTGSTVSYPWVHVEGTQWLTKSWDPEVPFPEDPDLFWDNPALRPILVDVDTGSVEPYPDVENGLFVSGIPFAVDGVDYYELSETGYVEGGNARIVELHPDGIRPAFSINGQLVALERVR